jgi:hypothetical protein
MMSSELEDYFDHYVGLWQLRSIKLPQSVRWDIEDIVIHKLDVIESQLDLDESAAVRLMVASIVNKGLTGDAAITEIERHRSLYT